MSVEALANHMERPLGRGTRPRTLTPARPAARRAATSSACPSTVDPNSPDGGIADAGFDANGCGAAIAAGSAAVALVRGERLLEAARWAPRRSPPSSAA